MRRIKSQEQIEMEKARNVKIMSGFMLAVLLLGTVGYAFSGSFDSNSDDGNNNGNVDENSDVGFVQPTINYGNQNIPITLKKGDVKGIQVNIQKSLSDLSGKTLYLDFEEENYLASEIQRSIGLFVSDIRRACYGTCESDLPERTCEDNMLVFRKSEEDIVRQENNCIFIDGDLKAVDAFIYHVFGQ